MRMEVIHGVRTLIYCCVLEFIFLRFFALSEDFELFIEHVQDLWIDTRLRIEYHVVLAALTVVQWTNVALWGAHMERWLSVALASCIRQKFNSWYAVLLVSLFTVLSTCRLRMRLSLRKRKRGIQLKKKASGLKRRKRFEQKLQGRGLSFLILMSCGYGCNAVDGEQFRQFMTGFGTLLQKQDVIVRGITESLAASSSSSTSVAKGLESAARILKAPEQFDPTSKTTWNTWRHSFLNWLSYADGRFLASIQDIEKWTPSDTVETADWSDQDWDLARKLYSILTSYLRGSALHLSRSEAENRNGFVLWKKLVDYYAPATRQRALSLSQAISSFPQFVPGADKTLQEHVSGMETLVQQYDALSSKAFDRDVLLGVLLRLCPDNIRQHLTLAISDSFSYQEVKERIFAYTRSSRMWNVNDVLKTVGKQMPSSSKGDAGPVPMEVDAVMRKKSKNGS